MLLLPIILKTTITPKTNPLGSIIKTLAVRTMVRRIPILTLRTVGHLIEATILDIGVIMPATDHEVGFPVLALHSIMGPRIVEEEVVSTTDNGLLRDLVDAVRLEVLSMGTFTILRHLPPRRLRSMIHNHLGPLNAMIIFAIPLEKSPERMTRPNQLAKARAKHRMHRYRAVIQVFRPPDNRVRSLALLSSQRPHQLPPPSPFRTLPSRCSPEILPLECVIRPRLAIV